jgi:hypothetical protein
MAANRPDPRDAILDRFESGEIDKEQADAEAVAAGFASMERRPDFAGIDCCELARWTMPQLMAWVIDRTSEAVLALSEEFRIQTRLWQKDEKWRLRPPHRLTLYDLTAEAVAKEEVDGRPRRALRSRAELLRQFIQGALTAYGKRRGDDEHLAIPKTAWNTIDLFELPCYHFDPEDIGREGEATPRYTDVYVIPNEVISAWPRSETQPEKTQTPVKKTNAPTKPEELTRALLRRFPEGRPSLSLPDLLKLLETEFGQEIGSFSERSVRRALKEAWPHSSRRGQRSAKSAKSAKSAN